MYKIKLHANIIIYTFKRPAPVFLLRHKNILIFINYAEKRLNSIYMQEKHIFYDINIHNIKYIVSVEITLFVTGFIINFNLILYESNESIINFK